MSAKIKRIVPALLDWYAANARDLPWRREPDCSDPYCVYVSEIMLQQTQVKTVIPYWERWMRALPDIQSLADADTATIHKLWEGLGYYTRVRNMQQAAREILARHHGEFPRTHAEILALPGIGPYTAGAIASIAFGQPAPILDGNVIRVLTRVFAIAENPREKSTNQKLWHLAQQLVTAAAVSEHATRNTQHAPPNFKPKTLNLKPSAVSRLNQSLMELGALICTPKQPKCPECPVRQNCRAHRLGNVEQFPNLAKRAAATQRRFLAFVIKNRGRYLVRQRPAGQVNAHLWEFPNVEIPANPLIPSFSPNGGEGARRADEGVAPKRSLRERTSVRSPLGEVRVSSPRLLPIQQASDLANAHLGLRLTHVQKLCTLKHTITRYRITLDVVIADCGLRIADSPEENGRWLKPAELHLLPFTSAHGKILQRILA